MTPLDCGSPDRNQPETDLHDQRLRVCRGCPFCGVHDCRVLWITNPHFRLGTTNNENNL